MKDLFRMPGMRANLMNVRKKKPGYIPPSQPDLNGCDTCHGACSVSRLRNGDFGEHCAGGALLRGRWRRRPVPMRRRLFCALLSERGHRFLLHTGHLPSRHAVQRRSAYSPRSKDLQYSAPRPGCVHDAEVMRRRDRSGVLWKNAGV
ncbi:hypothetical protein F443_23012 [Phytophthora nicotianae P1569]|nr:hypothetical protein F443_23012 [Phytophthora nicotianae P1569]